METRVLSAEDWSLWRDLRLRSLADSPDAFGSTLALETAFTESDWREWLEDPTVVVLADGEAVGCGAVFENRPGHAAVIAMWVAPNRRGRGVSRPILDVLVGWAHGQDLVAELGVNRGNARARAAYESYGFVATARCHRLREGSEQVCDVLELPPTRG